MITPYPNYTFRDAVDDLNRGVPSPLKSIVLNEGYEWTNENAFRRSDYIPDDSQVASSLMLNNVGWGGKSGSVRLTMAEGWRADWFFYSENNEFFTDNTVQALEAQAQIRRELIYDESLEITLSSGDYFSFDIDEEHDGTFRFRLIKDGVQVSIDDPENPNNEVIISMKNAQYDDGQITTPTCPTGFIYDTVLRQCVAINGEDGTRPDPTCPEGYTYNRTLAVCQQNEGGGGGGPSPSCEDGYEYNSSTGLCEKIVVEEESSPLFGFLILGVIALGLWWLFTKTGSQNPQPDYVKPPPPSGGVTDA